MILTVSLNVFWDTIIFLISNPASCVGLWLKFLFSFERCFTCCCLLSFSLSPVSVYIKSLENFIILVVWLYYFDMGLNSSAVVERNSYISEVIYNWQWFICIQNPRATSHRPSPKCGDLQNSQRRRSAFYTATVPQPWARFLKLYMRIKCQKGIIN